MITNDDLLKLLKKACKEAGTQRKWALTNGISPAYVNDVLHGNRDVGKVIVEALLGVGYEKKPMWVKKND